MSNNNTNKTSPPPLAFTERFVAFANDMIGGRYPHIKAYPIERGPSVTTSHYFGRLIALDAVVLRLRPGALNFVGGELDWDFSRRVNNIPASILILSLSALSQEDIDSPSQGITVVELSHSPDYSTEAELTRGSARPVLAYTDLASAVSSTDFQRITARARFT